MKFEKIQPGMVLYDVHSYRMGNTKLSTMGCWPVEVLTIDRERSTAMARWNGNRPQLYFRRDLEKLRAKEPEFETGMFGRQLLKRRPKKPAEHAR